MKSSRDFFMQTCERAKLRSEKPDYIGCSIHVNAVVEMVDGEPKIMSYAISDWYISGCTVRTYIDGKEI